MEAASTGYALPESDSKIKTAETKRKITIDRVHTRNSTWPDSDLLHSPTFAVGSLSVVACVLSLRLRAPTYPFEVPRCSDHVRVHVECFCKEFENGIQVVALEHRR